MDLIFLSSFMQYGKPPIFKSSFILCLLSALVTVSLIPFLIRQQFTRSFASFLRRGLYSQRRTCPRMFKPAYYLKSSFVHCLLSAFVTVSLVLFLISQQFAHFFAVFLRRGLLFLKKDLSENFQACLS